jgi:glycosyltransferase involved in cell wall biosynthesis
LREQPALGHLTISDAPPDLLLANSQTLTEQARRLGYECTTIPSVVMLDDIRVERPGARVVMVSPTRLHGVEIATAVVAARPDIPFLIQESSLRLTKEEWSALRASVAGLPNVELRPFSPDPRTFYAECRILFAPHQVDNRPRVILEAQFNGIPVLASAWPGIAEAVGRGGVLVPHDAPTGEWVAGLSAIWDDQPRWSQLSAAAHEHARRDEVRPDLVAEQFEHAMSDLLQAAGGRSQTQAALDG